MMYELYTNDQLPVTYSSLLLKLSYTESLSDKLQLDYSYILWRCGRRTLTSLDPLDQCSTIEGMTSLITGHTSCAAARLAGRCAVAYNVSFFLSSRKSPACVLRRSSLSQLSIEVWVRHWGRRIVVVVKYGHCDNGAPGLLMKKAEGGSELVEA